jgi:hypothetical protein
VQPAAGRAGLLHCKLPPLGAARRQGIRQRPNPEARRGSSGALSVSLLYTT